MIDTIYQDYRLPEEPSALPSAATASWLRRVTVQDFRSYAQGTLECGAGPVVLFGENGAGKTNLLEAVSLFAPGRGLRAAALSELPRQRGEETGSWAVSALLESPKGQYQLGTGVPEGAERERRIMRVDGRNVKGQAAFTGLLRVVWLTPQMDSLFRDGPSSRRRFLDRLLSTFDPEHVSRGHAYDHSLRERARLLREGVNDDAWLSALEDSLAGKGVAIAAARRDLSERLNHAAAQGVGPFPAVRLTTECQVDAWLRESPALAVEDRIRETLAAGRRRDAEAGGASVGPHRAELLAEHLGKGQEARLCSTGEQKAILIAIVMAHARLIALQEGQAPLILLDEVAAHLDEQRREALFEELAALGGQAWMTGTDPQVFESLRSTARFFEVRDGEIRSVKG